MNPANQIDQIDRMRPAGRKTLLAVLGMACLLAGSSLPAWAQQAADRPATGNASPPPSRADFGFGSGTGIGPGGGLGSSTSVVGGLSGQISGPGTGSQAFGGGFSGPQSGGVFPPVGSSPAAGAGGAGGAMGR